MVRCAQTPTRARGAALLEAVIALPVMVFVVLGVLQLMLVQHAKVITEYAAYSAARAGIVHNANWNVMRNAALIATLPLYERTDDFAHFVVAWGKIKAVAELTEAVDTTVGTLERLAGDLIGVEISGLAQDISLVEIHVTSPNRQAFGRAEQWQARQEQKSQDIDPRGVLEYPEDEIDFDDAAMLAEHPELARLAVETRVLYPMRIPLLNKIIFELYLAVELLRAREFTADLHDAAQQRTRLADGRYLDEAVAETSGDGPLDDFFTTSQWVRELRTLRTVADRFDIYFLPLKASYAMPMQSNMFQKNRREPVWFTLEDF